MEESSNRKLKNRVAHSAPGSVKVGVAVLNKVRCHHCFEWIDKFCRKLINQCPSVPTVHLPRQRGKEREKEQNTQAVKAAPHPEGTSCCVNPKCKVNYCVIPNCEVNYRVISKRKVNYCVIPKCKVNYCVIPKWCKVDYCVIPNCEVISSSIERPELAQASHTYAQENHLTHINAHASTNASAHCSHAYTYTCIYTHTHTHTHTHTYTHTHTRTYSCSHSSTH